MTDRLFPIGGFAVGVAAGLILFMGPFLSGGGSPWTGTLPVIPGAAAVGSPAEIPGLPVTGRWTEGRQGLERKDEVVVVPASHEEMVELARSGPVWVRRVLVARDRRLTPAEYEAEAGRYAADGISAPPAIDSVETTWWSLSGGKLSAATSTLRIPEVTGFSKVRLALDPARGRVEQTYARSPAKILTALTVMGLGGVALALLLRRIALGLLRRGARSEATLP